MEQAILPTEPSFWHFRIIFIQSEAKGWWQKPSFLITWETEAGRFQVQDYLSNLVSCISKVKNFKGLSL